MCEIEKEFTEFRESKRHKDGYLNECKDCISIKRREYYLENIDRHKKITKEYYEKNKIELYEKVDREKKRESDRKYILKNKEKRSIKSKLYYEENKEVIKEKSNRYYYDNKEKINKPSDRKRELRRKYYRERKHQYVWREILRKTITQLKQEKKQTTQELLMYSYDDLKTYIENKFQNGMSWENHGEWHVDHIIPIALFKDDTLPSIVNRMDNLRPLWADENLSKQNSIESIKDEYSELLLEFKKYLLEY